MSTRKIPEIVYDAGYAAYVHGGTPTAIIEAAMPLAFAAELRILLARWRTTRSWVRSSVSSRAASLSWTPRG